MRAFSKQRKPKISLALRAAAIQQHMEVRLGDNFDPIIKPKSPKKVNPILKKQPCKCHHHHEFKPIPTASIFESETVKTNEKKYKSQLTLAERLGIIEPPPAPLTDEQFETVKIEAEKRGFFNEACPICLEKFGPDNMVLLSCSHLLHATCLMNFRKFSRGHANLCPVCRQPYEFVQVKAEAAYNNRCAIDIQRVFRGFMVRNKLGELAPEGSELHRRWVLSRAHLASDRLVSAVDRQSDAIDAVLGSIDHDLEWARAVMRAAEEQGREIDWSAVKQKAVERCAGDCPVCLRPMKESDSAVTSCGHMFHIKCLQSWLKFCEGSSQTPTCPCCRSPFQWEPIQPQIVTDVQKQDPNKPITLDDAFQDENTKRQRQPKKPVKKKPNLPKRAGWR